MLYGQEDSPMNERDKIIVEIAAVEDPLYTTGQGHNEIECHFCEEMMFDDPKRHFPHEDNCIWIRAKVLTGKEPGPNAIVIAEGVIWERDK